MWTVRLIGESESAEVRLEAGKPITIGRASMADVRVMDLSAGRYVVRLTHTPEGVWVEDLASGGGSALELGGEVRPRPNCLLPDGAVLQIGGVRFRVAISES